MTMEIIPLIVCIVIAIVIVTVRRTIAAQLKANRALATIDGFDPAVKYAGTAAGVGLALDPASDRFAIVRRGAEPTLYRFDQLVAVDVERNGATVTTTKGSNGLAGAAVGVALLGPAGLLLGRGTKSRGVSTPTVTKLSLKIFVNDLIRPCHEVVFYQNRQGGNASGLFVTTAARQLDEWYGRFRTILSMREAAAVTGIATDRGENALPVLPA